MFNNLIANEYVWSALITFITAFGAAIVPFIGAQPATMSALFAILAVGLRAGVTAIINLASTKGQTISSKAI